MKAFVKSLLLFFSAFFEIATRELNLAVGGVYTDIGLVSTCPPNRAPGIRTTLYFVPVDEIDTFPDVMTSTAAGDSITLDGNIVLKTTPTGKGYWRRVEIITDTGEFKFSLVGERGFQAWKNTLDFFLAGTSRENREWAQEITCGKSICMLETRENSGEYVVIGEPNDPCFFEKADGATGTKVGEGKTGIMFSLRDAAGKIARAYLGTIDLTPNV